MKLGGRRCPSRPEYSYQANGKIQQISNNLDALKTEKYSYDELGRLLTAQRGPDGNIQRKYTYVYDRYGNRPLQDLVAGTGYDTQFSFNTANNKVSTFSYDGSGNVTNSGTGTTFSYNLENRMVTAGTSSYAYDAQGRRVRKDVGGVVTDYFYSGAVVMAEKQGSVWTDYIFFGGQRIAQQTGSTASTANYLHTDHLGSTRVCTDGNGDSNGTCDYEPFGEIQPGASCSALPTNYRFAGMELDSETGLYHTWFRQYDPTQGRWLEVDPLSGSEGDPQSQNRYVYVVNDPGNLIDPLGLEPQCEQECVDVIIGIDDGLYIWGQRCRTKCKPQRFGPGGSGGGRGLAPKPQDQQECAEQVVDTLAARDGLKPFLASAPVVKVGDDNRIEVTFRFNQPFQKVLASVNTFTKSPGGGHRSNFGRLKPGFELHRNSDPRRPNFTGDGTDVDRFSPAGDLASIFGHAGDVLGRKILNGIGSLFGFRVKEPPPCDLLKKL